MAVDAVILKGEAYPRIEAAVAVIVAPVEGEIVQRGQRPLADQLAAAIPHAVEQRINHAETDGLQVGADNFALIVLHH